MVEVVDDDTMTIERKLFCILSKSVGFPRNGPDSLDNSVVVDDDKCAMFLNV